MHDCYQVRKLNFDIFKRETFIDFLLDLFILIDEKS